MEKSSQLIYGISCPKVHLSEEAKRYKTIVIIKMILLVLLVITAISLLLYLALHLHTEVKHPYDGICIGLSSIFLFVGLYFFDDFLGRLEAVKFVCLSPEEQKKFISKFAHECAEAKYKLLLFLFMWK